MMHTSNSRYNQSQTFMDALEGSISLVSTERGKESQSAGRLFTILLFVMFIGVLLLAFMAGTSVYKSLSVMDNTANEKRAALSLLANSVRGNDALKSVGVGEGPEGESLVLTEYFQSGTFETRIYLYKGEILQEYTLAGTDYMPSRAISIVPSKTFAFDYDPDNGLLSITTDQGTSKIALRTLREGA